ncbi:MAG: ABC transporter ATP-binding protein, partial [Firmicutes bacterium]|nr:ABC transporter ATP-binding protein [Bacillota bacterium]
GKMGLLSGEDRKKVLRSMRAMKTEELFKRNFAEISDGQRKRVLLARALCQEADIMVLDEPTAFLDIRHKLEFLSLLRILAKEKGITALVALHETELAQRAADRLICIKDKKIFAFGTPEEIFVPNIIEPLYGLPEGSFNELFGTVELFGAKDKAKIFVICGGGTGIPVFKKLQRAGTAFLSGVLHENDLDYRAAKFLSAGVVSEKAFCPISDEALARAKELMLGCEKVIRTDFPLGEGNKRQLELIEFARKRGLLKENEF